MRPRRLRPPDWTPIGLQELLAIIVSALIVAPVIIALAR